jgi:hypothetical protein
MMGRKYFDDKIPHPKFIVSFVLSLSHAVSSFYKANKTFQQGSVEKERKMGG